METVPPIDFPGGGLSASPDRMSWTKPNVVELFGKPARQRRLECLDDDIQELDRLGIDHPIEVALPGTPEFYSDPLNILKILSALDGQQPIVVEKLGLIAAGGRA